MSAKLFYSSIIVLLSFDLESFKFQDRPVMCEKININIREIDRMTDIKDSGGGVRRWLITYKI